MATQVTFTSASPPGPSVSAVLIGSAKQSREGGSSASASSGGGGWQVVDRARKGATTEWVDYYPIVLSMSCMLDGGSGLTPASVEPQIALLESFELPAAGTSPPMPPLLSIAGPVQHTELTWVCSRLELTGGDRGSIRDPFFGVRTQQAFTIELTQYSASNAITDPNLTPAQLAQLTTGPGGLTTVAPVGTVYVVVQGDTFQSIAATQLGNVNLALSIANLNGLALSTPLAPGALLQLPAK